MERVVQPVPKIGAPRTSSPTRTRHSLRLVAIGLTAGFISSLLGIAGTLVIVLVLVPVLRLAFPPQTKRTGEISVATILLGSLAEVVVVSMLLRPNLH